jgi:ribosomal protein S18 acetylase RimI-like enzyme
VRSTTTADGLSIRRLEPGDEAVVERAAVLFDDLPLPDATARFLAEPGHHLLIAERDGATVGFITGVETVHPDKGAEMFFYELGVDEPARRQGVGHALVKALVDLARSRGCYGMWVLTDADNDAALATYGSAGAVVEGDQVMLGWNLS